MNRSGRSCCILCYFLFFLFVIYIFICFLNKGFSLYKEYCFVYLGRFLFLVRIFGVVVGWVGGGFVIWLKSSGLVSLFLRIGYYGCVLWGVFLVFEVRVVFRSLFLYYRVSDFRV